MLIKALARHFRHSGVVAVWSARWAHNPEVGGSNPPPANYLNSHTFFSS